MGLNRIGKEGGIESDWIGGVRRRDSDRGKGRDGRGVFG